MFIDTLFALIARDYIRDRQLKKPAAPSLESDKDTWQEQMLVKFSYTCIVIALIVFILFKLFHH